MTKFQPAHYDPSQIAAFPGALTGDVFLNDTYQVLRRPCPETPGWPAMLSLSIKRIDREPIHDWRDLQAIKNAIVGPEHEAVELYPAESRLVDSSNQFWLWVLAEPGVTFPFGFHQGRLVTEESVPGLVTKQRPFAEKPADLLDAAELKRRTDAYHDSLRRKGL